MEHIPSVIRIPGSSGQFSSKYRQAILNEMIKIGDYYYYYYYFITATPF